MPVVVLYEGITGARFTRTMDWGASVYGEL